MNDNFELIKLVIAGSANTGKTILSGYLLNRELNFENYLPTIGVDFGTKVFLYKKNLYKLQIWDTAGETRFQPITNAYMKNVNILLALFNYNDRKTFDYAKSLFSKIENERSVFVLIGAKYDLKINTDKRDNIVDEEEVLKFSKEKNVLCAHLSLLEKNSNGVIELAKKVFDEYIIRKKIQ